MTYEGVDHYGRPKAEYLATLAAMTDEALYSETYGMIYQSARCANNPRADWHWRVDACYEECERRPGRIYKRAYDACYNEHAS